MPEEKTSTPTVEDEPTEDDARDKDAGPVDDDLDDVLDDDLDDVTPAKKDGDKAKERMYTKAELTAILEREKARDLKRRKKAEVAAAEAARKEAEEKQLLKDGNTAELLELRTQEVTEAKAQVEEFKRLDKANALLDKKEITDPEERARFLKYRVKDLAELAAEIDGYSTMLDRRVQEEVTKQLGTTPPPKAGEAPPEKAMQDMSPEEWMAYKKKNEIYGGKSFD